MKKEKEHTVPFTENVLYVENTKESRHTYLLELIN